MPIESQAIQRKFVVVDSTAPASPFEGQIWRDTSTQTTKQYANGSWASIQSSGDGQTVTKNGAGELQVPIDNQTIGIVNGEVSRIELQDEIFLGTFESGVGDWFFSNKDIADYAAPDNQQTYSLSTSTTHAKEGSQSLNANGKGGYYPPNSQEESPRFTLEYNNSISDVKRVELSLKFFADVNTDADQDSSVEVRVNGSSVWSLSASDQTTWKDLTVTSITDLNSIQVDAQGAASYNTSNPDYGSIDVYLDRVVVYTNESTIHVLKQNTSYNGAGE